MRGLSDRASLDNASGTTRSGDPYVRVFLPNGVPEACGSVVQRDVASTGTPDGGVSVHVRFVIRFEAVLRAQLRGAATVLRCARD